MERKLENKTKQSTLETDGNEKPNNKLQQNVENLSNSRGLDSSMQLIKPLMVSKADHHTKAPLMDALQTGVEFRKFNNCDIHIKRFNFY